MEFLRIPGPVNQGCGRSGVFFTGAPFGRSGCEVGECSWGDCAVIAWVMDGGVIASFQEKKGTGTCKRAVVRGVKLGGWEAG